MQILEMKRDSRPFFSEKLKSFYDCTEMLLLVSCGQCSVFSVSSFFFIAFFSNCKKDDQNKYNHMSDGHNIKP